MQNEEKCKYLNEIAKSHRDILRGRFISEWRVLTFTLVFYSLPLATIFNSEFRPPQQGLAFKLLVVFNFLIAIVTISFLRHLHCANSYNRSFAEAAENAIVDILNGRSTGTLKIFNKGSVKHTMWAWWWELTMISLLAVTSCGILWCR